MRFGHAVRLDGGVLEQGVVLEQERLLLVEELVDVLLRRRQQNLVGRLGEAAQERLQLLLLVLAAHRQLRSTSAFFFFIFIFLHTFKPSLFLAHYFISTYFDFSSFYLQLPCRVCPSCLSFFLR